MDRTLFGKILATVALAAVDIGAVTLDPKGVASNPNEIGEILAGFAAIWTTHKASGVNTQ